MVTNEFDFVRIEELDDEGSWNVVFEDHHGREYEANYYTDIAENFIICTSFNLTVDETHTASIAAFCFLSVILK